jgi:hypothetical protein
MHTTCPGGWSRPTPEQPFVNPLRVPIPRLLNPPPARTARSLAAMLGLPGSRPQRWRRWRGVLAGSDVNAQDSIRNSAFLLAGAGGHLEILRMTLGAGADLRSRDRFGGTALIPACHCGHGGTVRALLATAIDVDPVNELVWTALLEAVILGDGTPDRSAAGSSRRPVALPGGPRASFGHTTSTHRRRR